MRDLETQRLRLRPYRHSDWEQIHRYASIPEFSQYDVWGPNTEDDTKKFVADCIAKLSEDPVQRYEFVVEKANGAVIGGCSLKRSKEDPNLAGLGYAINPDYQRKGFATEAAVALIQFAFEDLGLSLVYAQCDTRNLASRSVMEKAGMKLATVLEQHQVVKGVMTNSYRYEIHREEHIS
jgi:RimJ/RimL family protein N-acetyltransferase